MTHLIYAPWTPEQVTALNAFQQADGMHPFTCGGDHTPASPVLVAKEDGWHCPRPYGEPCGYRQDWAHAFMVERGAAVSAAVAPPTQAAPSLRAGLRDEIVKALGRITTVPPVAHRREQADHVLAVLYREWPWLRAEAEDAEPTDKAAVLREVADELTRKANKLTERVHDLAYFVAKDRLREAEILDREATALRRMADETATEESDGARLATLETDLADGPVRCPLCPTPLTLHTPSGARAHFTTVHPEQRITGRESGPWPLLVADETATETPFTPHAHYRRDDSVDCCVHAIPVGPDSCQACRELADEQPASGPTIVDQVVAALQAKAQALSVEAEEEMRRDLEEQAQVWHEAADLARRTSRKAARSEQPAAGARQDGTET